ncbi:Histone-lysine N-methyltransferase SETMAR [Eumeta japonica]|uniref:Histone-lysine N-methyltransferase SETMAR n=1 Tax=Eumeta variegata TaxID=151549 RepID=A0A4C1SMW0_EUMVA|nr:Histone-lysine N-methyltransferase SETMAR [Eumeta japonica]
MKAYEPNAVSVRVAQNWFKRYLSGNFDVKDEPRSGRPVTDKVDVVLEKVKQDRHISSYDIAEEPWIDHKTVLTHLKKQWVLFPSEVSQKADARVTPQAWAALGAARALRREEGKMSEGRKCNFRFPPSAAPDERGAFGNYADIRNEVVAGVHVWTAPK